MKPIAAFCLLLLALVAVSGIQAAPFVPRMLLLDGVVTKDGIIVVGERGAILRSVDAGQTWTEIASPVAATLTGVSFAPATAFGWAVGHDALIIATTDGGHTWAKQWQGELQDSFLDVMAIDSQHVIAVGAYGLCCATADGGKTWTRQKVSDGDYHFNRLNRGPTGTLYLAGEHGTLLRSTDRGASWHPIDSPYDGSFYGILPLDATTLLAYGLRGRIYRSTDDGATWTVTPIEQRMLLATAAKLPGGLIVFAGQSRAWFVSRDDGKSVSPWAVGSTAAVSRLLVLSDGTLLALGEGGAIRIPAP